jgi:short subunit dehydrogenase-like uncharacterized protein
MAGFIDTITMLVFGVCLVSTPLQWLLRTFVLPKPGQGPSVADMDKGFLRVSAVGKGDKGGKVSTQFYFPTDPGYRDTARMLVESGLSLALEGDKIKSGGGVFTPAACQQEVLLQRLIKTGSSFEIKKQ